MNCTGHICYWGDREYFEVPGAVYHAKRDAKRDPSGYPLGAEQAVPCRFGVNHHTKESIIAEIKEFLNKYPSDYKFVDPSEEELFNDQQANPVGSLRQSAGVC